MSRRLGQCATTVVRPRTPSIGGDSMLDSVDAARLCSLIDDVKELDIHRLLVEMMPTGHTGELHRGDLATLLEHCSFDHEGVLVFPEAVGDVTQFLRRLGLDVRFPVASVVVRERLARRYDV